MSTERRWVAAEASTLATILHALGESDAAITDGRVFVGRKRARSGAESVAAGEEVRVHPPRERTVLPEPFVLHDRDGILAVDKPARLPTIPDLEGSAGSLIDLAARATNRIVDSLHPTSRLDRDVSGVVTFACDAAAAERLAAARAAGTYRRRYLALAFGDLVDGLVGGVARWTWPIARDRDPRKRRAVEVGAAADDARPSATRVRVIRRGRGALLLAIAPETGRPHQIRVHAARAGVPLIGDALYGGPRRMTSASGAVRTAGRVALHCASVSIECIMSVRSPVPPELVEWLALCGIDGGAAVLEEAMACDV